MFGYPKFDKNGTKVLTRMDGKNSNMLMDITVQKLEAMDSIIVEEQEKETAILLVQGKIEYQWEGKTVLAERKSWLNDFPYCLHIPKGVIATVVGVEDSEIIIQCTTNDRVFESKMYAPDDVQKTVSCDGLWENTAVRDVITIFDYNNAPYSNMVIGEVYCRQGRWWSYIPHSHPQPEVYYYKFLSEEGFGACFLGDKAYTIKDGSYGCIEGGLIHPQVTAPGYPMYNCWMIRHLDGNPWTTRVDDTRFTHLLSK